FASPWIIGFLLFTAGPMIASFYLGFTEYSMGAPPRWVGLANYQQAFTGGDPQFWPSLGRTFLYAITIVPLGLTGSLLIALLLNQHLRGTAVFRTLFFLPSLVPIVASAVLWQWLFQPEFGAINWLLSLVGIQGPLWMADSRWAMPSLMVMALWGAIGGSTMVIFLAGLQGVPLEMHEAASIDGAGPVQRFFRITLPLITPTIFFNLIIGLIGALKVFEAAFVATKGGPNYATWFFILHLYQTAFQNVELGYASALAGVFFVVVVALTLVNIALSRRWVYYEGETR
ncbi:MAG: sugar ABC transporter permease, partial [Chloroflexi bacterium]|nr:sugar ABC transporter permease [Chloroflexota bacterium]